MSVKSESKSSKALFHLKELKTIIYENNESINVLKDENNLLDNNYKQLKEKYDILLNNFQQLEQNYNQLKVKTENIKINKRDIECQTDSHQFNDSINDESDCHLFVNQMQTFIGTNRESDILCDDSSDETFDPLIDGNSDLNYNMDSIDEIPDSLDNSLIECDIDIEDNDCVIVEEDVKPTFDPLLEIPDSLNNSPINSSKSPENNYNLINKQKNEDNCNAIKIEDNCNAIKYETNVDNKNAILIKTEKCEPNIENKIIKKEKCQTITTSGIYNNINVKEEKEEEINDRINIKRDNNKSNDNSSPKIKYVVKTLGPSVRNKSERKKLNGYTCKECEDYYKTRNLTEEELKSRLNACSRHRAKWSPVKSPEHFWETDFPSTPECIKRGNLLIEDKPSPYITERKRPKKAIQTKLNFNKL